MRRLLAVIAALSTVPLAFAPSVGASMPGLVSAAASGATSGRPVNIVLTPTTSEATAQQVTWRTRKAHTQQRIEVTPQDGGRTLVFTARRKARTTVEDSGSAMPVWTARAAGLRPGTAYTYRVRNKVASSAHATFTTAHEGDVPWRFLALGDTQVANAEVPADIVRTGLRRFPDSAAVLHVGDVVNLPWVKSEWTDLMRALAPARTRRDVLASVGNHEQCVLLKSCRHGDAEGFRAAFTFPDNGFEGQRPTWFSVDRQGVRFVVLDVFGPDLPTQVRFLDEQLAANDQRWSVVLMHSGPVAARASRTNDAVFDRVRPVLQEHDVDLVLSGHDHSYARGHLGDADSTVYATSVSGVKFYESSDADWVRRNATRVRWAERTATYQVVDVSRDRLRYRAIVAHRGSGAEPEVAVGSTLDDVRLTKDDEGRRTVTW